MPHGTKPGGRGKMAKRHRLHPDATKHSWSPREKRLGRIVFHHRRGEGWGVDSGRAPLINILYNMFITTFGIRTPFNGLRCILYFYTLAYVPLRNERPCVSWVPFARAERRQRRTVRALLSPGWGEGVGSLPRSLTHTWEKNIKIIIRRRRAHHSTRLKNEKSDLVVVASVSTYTQCQSSFCSLNSHHTWPESDCEEDHSHAAAWVFFFFLFFWGGSVTLFMMQLF